MGWFDEEVGSEHEGYAVTVAMDGRIVTSMSAGGMRFGNRGDDEIPMPWSQLRGWTVRCACGWVGSSWDHADATDPDCHDAESAVLADGSIVAVLAEAEWEQHIEPLRALGKIREATANVRRAQGVLALAVVNARTMKPAMSWRKIGEAASMSGQSAYERWSNYDSSPA